ncbi:alpha/beta fold hydrolase [Cellulosimicrobium protaetiae]|uniref:Alpha/beta fold hydrolase n=1 Tax=Cellulosimicrobium protaetiae TaxID=2587808 RepID=A0A6M5UBG9_9MICO|nr:alpha/beta fold hydrolase [Cellulosimicrobium protaetiae]QJW35600.1 alpha/beta fold hydrolase [Cellulosimicrobium protaetiae]
MTDPIGAFRDDAARLAYERAYDDLAARWPLPSTVTTVETTFGPTRVRTSGAGTRTPLVLLHGLNGTGLSWHAVVGRFAADRVVHAPDVVGTAGASVQTAPLTRPSDYGAWGEQLLDGLGIERAHVLGYSEGAWFGALLGGRAPERLASLTLGEGITTLVKPSPRVVARMVGASLWPTERAFARLDSWLSPGADPTDEDRALARAAMRYRRRTPWPSPLDDAALAAITTPTLAVFGAETRLGDPRAAARRVLDHVPRAEVAIVPGGGHGVLWQLPDRVLPVVHDFLDRHEASRPEHPGASSPGTEDAGS